MTQELRHRLRFTKPRVVYTFFCAHLYTANASESTFGPYYSRSHSRSPLEDHVSHFNLRRKTGRVPVLPARWCTRRQPRFARPSYEVESPRSEKRSASLLFARVRMVRSSTLREIRATPVVTSLLSAGQVKSDWPFSDWEITEKSV